VNEATRKLAAILSTDAVGYSRLMADDEAATIQTLNANREEISGLVRHHQGRVVDAPGDNLLAEFPTARDAVKCAVEMQLAVQARNASLRPERQMEYRVGVNLGDVTVEGERIYGHGVNVTARLESLAEPAGVCISGTVFEQVDGKLDYVFDDLGIASSRTLPSRFTYTPYVPRTLLQSRGTDPSSTNRRPRAHSSLGGVCAVKSVTRSVNHRVTYAFVTAGCVKDPVADKAMQVRFSLEKHSGSRGASRSTTNRRRSPNEASAPAVDRV
jgi:class 3 adenylate cyclase